MARQGLAGQGEARRGLARQSWLGLAGQGEARRGLARQSWLGLARCCESSGGGAGNRSPASAVEDGTDNHKENR